MSDSPSDPETPAEGDLTPETLFEATPEIYEWIGRVSTSWATLETFIDMDIWSLAGVNPDTGACITANLQSANRRLQTLLALLRMRGADEGLATAINVFIRDADSLARRRNRIIHDPWVRYKGTYYRWEVTAERRLFYGVRHDTVDDLKKLEADIREAIQRWNVLAVKTQPFFQPLR
jgi:hypothetical protein